MEQKLIITPKTKIYALLEAYPELEDLLIETAPAFEKLKNPLLRKTVAKIATIQQAATIGNIDTSELVNMLRKKTGQQEIKGEYAVNDNINLEKPDWFDESKIIREFDVKPMLNAGEHPVNQVLSDLKKLESGKIYKMIAPFLPVPLIEKATGLGFEHWAYQNSEQDYEIYFIAK